MHIGLCGGQGPLRQQLDAALRDAGWTVDPGAELQLWLPPRPGDDYVRTLLVSLEALPLAGRVVVLCDETTQRRAPALPECWVQHRLPSSRWAGIRWQDVLTGEGLLSRWLADEEGLWPSGGTVAPVSVSGALTATLEVLLQLAEGSGWGVPHAIHGRVRPAEELAARVAQLAGLTPRLTEQPASSWMVTGGLAHDEDLERVLAEQLVRAGLTVHPSPVRVPFVRPNTQPSPALSASWAHSLASGRLSNGGPRVTELEQRLASWLGVADCVVVSSGGMALELLARTVDKDGAVVLPSYTFAATAAAFSQRQLHFADIDADTLTLCPHDAARALASGDAAALVAVNAFGTAADLATLAEVARTYDVDLLVDDAHGLGTPSSGPPLLPRAGSLHATKQLVAAEGGWVTGPPDRLAAVRQLRDHGRAGGCWVPGVNGRMDELRAALALTSLEQLEQTLRERRATAERLRARLRQRGWWVQADPHHCSGFQNLACALPGVPASRVVAALHAQAVEARRYFAIPLHHLPAFPDASLPVTDARFAELLCLPLHNRMRRSEQAAVLAAIDAVTGALCS